MKVKSIDSASLIIAAIVMLFTLAGALVGGITNGGWWWLAPLLTLAAGATTFFTSRFVIRKFVIYKIKPIYQIVFSKDMSTAEVERRLEHKANLIEFVGDELNSWAEENRTEIARLKENEQYRKEFLGNVSHELKTPIFNIQGYISTLLDGGMNDRTINRHYLEKSEKNIDRLINIVNDLDEISKLESGVLNLQITRFDIVDLTREIVDGIEFEATKRDIRIVIDRDPANPQPAVMVAADRRYIEQVLVNLIVNSIRYGNRGGTTSISFVDLFDKVMVEVADDGIGISREDQPRVFERFYRSDKSRSREEGGTGLGLAIVKHIINAHNERINLRSELGRGSTFSFTLRKN